MLKAFLDEHWPDIGWGEKAPMFSIIWKAFVPRPEDRITASELLGQEEFAALMGFYGVQ